MKSDSMISKAQQGIYIVFLFLVSCRDPNIRKAEMQFSEMNGFSIYIREIDTITNEKFANILIEDFGSSYVADKLLLNPKDIHHYSLKGERRKRKKYSSYSPWEFAFGIYVDQDFKQIKNPLQYRIDRIINGDKTGSQKRQKTESFKSKNTQSLKDIDLSKYEYGETKK